MKPNRRRFLKTGIAGSMGAAAGMASGGTHPPTPSQTEGPFYPIQAQKDKDFDLTQVEGRQGTAKGDVIWVEGTVVDTEGNPVEGATVDIWQANAAGRYAHPHDDHDAPLDPNFQGWAIVPSGKQGGFKFKSIRPGAYPLGRRSHRTPHIHFKVSKRGYVELVTQMYFPGEPMNEKDRLLQRKSEAEQALMTAEQVADEPPTFRWQIVLEAV